MNLDKIFLLILTSKIMVKSDTYRNSSRYRNKNGARWNTNWLFGNQNWFRSPVHASSTNNRQSRFLSLFTVVNIDKQTCVGATGELGACLTQNECLKRGGTPNGSCAEGFAFCCVFIVTCGATVRENGTYFVNKGYPNQYDGTGSCQISLMKSQVDVCQFRLDFDQFILVGPEMIHHMCNNDQFIVSGGNPVPAICGLNTGNHMYIDSAEALTNPVILSVVTSGPAFMRNWKIKVTQIKCSMPNRGEEGCLQYYTGVAGQIRSFNYDPATGLQLSNQDYSICIRTERNFCGIQFTQCPDTVNNRTQSFTLSGNSNNAVVAMVGSTGSANFCQADFLVIPMAMNIGRPPAAPMTTVDRICGGTFSAEVNIMPATVRSNVKPFRLWFHTDNTESPTDVMNRGFCLNYVQQPCANIVS
ncbi:hypothetical protein RN001_009783 [Aquatica leii]|uniref:CUB domain-containing protein n=1 Tax=Aquatica leii TaxID=1421715 RepID=A0AAN7SE23_9COLE|nr:hypothetical protein RN001_009783 [Aquatica leii]